jgi:hypothetical protein
LGIDFGELPTYLDRVGPEVGQVAWTAWFAHVATREDRHKSSIYHPVDEWIKWVAGWHILNNLRPWVFAETGGCGKTSGELSVDVEVGVGPEVG